MALRGQALLWPLAVMTAWMGWRVVENAGPQTQPKQAISVKQKQLPTEPKNGAEPKPEMASNTDFAKRIWPEQALRKNGAAVSSHFANWSRQPFTVGVTKEVQVRKMSAKIEAGNILNPLASLPTRQTNNSPSAPMQPIGKQIAVAPKTSIPRKTPKRLSLYGYLFWREGSGNTVSSIAPSAQYGGSQAGLVATYRLVGKKAPLSLVLRASKAIDARDTEFSAGLRWQPLAKLPVSISAEKRIRRGVPDDVVIYAAGGTEKMLRAKVKLRAYGQAGITIPINSRDRSDRFFDGSLNATRKILGSDERPVSAGAGLWAGGQRGVRRVDIGPTIETKLKIGSANLQLSADWRFRIGGNARPKSGPAITLSTSY